MKPKYYTCNPGQELLKQGLRVCWYAAGIVLAFGLVMAVTPDATKTPTDHCRMEGRC